MASGAGLNRIGGAGGVVVLRSTANDEALSDPLSGYGTAGQDSGVVLTEGTGFTKVGFMIVPAPNTLSDALADFEFTVYYTLDTRAYGQWEASINPNRYLLAPGGAPEVPASAWTELPGPSTESGTGMDANPMTLTHNSMSGSRGAVAYRVCLTTAGTAGVADVIGFLVP